VPSAFWGRPASRVKPPAELASEAALLAHLGVSPSELRKIWWFRGKMYTNFNASRPRKKARYISAPDERLKYLQRKIAPLLDQMYRVRHPVHGFVAGKSVKTNAEAHLRKRYIVNLDLKDFFPTITENRVIGMLEALGLDARVASIVARICTNRGCLPQGAPTSPVLSNMICFRMDKELLGFSKSARCIYTRYADDITFSSYQPMASLFESAVPGAGRFAVELLSVRLRSIFSNNGFQLNEEKSHYADKYSRRMVTGLKVNEIINVDRKYVRNIRAALLSVECGGVAAADAKFKSQLGGGRKDLEDHLFGKIAWLRHIRGQSDPVFRAIALRFNASFPGRKIEVVPTRDEVRDRSVWVVEHFEGDMAQGSAFFLSGVGLVTAAHCVTGATEVDLYHPSKPANKFKASIDRVGKHFDIAILNHSIPQTEYFELTRSINVVSVGDALTAMGYPGFAVGDRLNVRPGTVSSLPTKSGVSYIEVTQKLSQGMSGGPLVDAHDAVVGITHKGGPDEGRDFAVHIDMLDRL